MLQRIAAEFTEYHLLPIYEFGGRRFEILPGAPAFSAVSSHSKTQLPALSSI